MTHNPLILDTDGGIDDAQALIMLLAHGRRPAAITTVFGNVSLELATRNMRAVLALTGAGDIPVIAGQGAPMSQPVIDAAHVHGEDGLGGAVIPDELPPLAGHDGVDHLRRTLAGALASGGKVDLLMIGPLTNLAVALLIEPGLAAAVGQLTIMGGTVYGRGNTTPAAEFNIYADPEAADIVFGAGIPTVVVPWEPCTTHFLTGERVEQIHAGRSGPLAAFNKAIADRTRHVVRRFAGVDQFRFVDPFAAAVLIEPSLIEEAVEASVAVALAPGLTRGMTLVDPSGRLERPKITLVERGNLARLDSLYEASVAWHH